MEFEDYLVPIGSAICALIALFLLYLKYATQAGWVQGPVAQIVSQTQPPCLTAFYAIAVVVSVIVLTLWIIQSLVRRR
jgi:hypothetical protein